MSNKTNSQFFFVAIWYVVFDSVISKIACGTMQCSSAHFSALGGVTNVAGLHVWAKSSAFSETWALFPSVFLNFMNMWDLRLFYELFSEEVSLSHICITFSVSLRPMTKTYQKLLGMRVTLMWLAVKSSTWSVLCQQFIKCLISNLDWRAIKAIPGYKPGTGWHTLEWQ